ncbi:hypothetical protein GCM10009836_14600 [Pseudonocardia ailaonensis]|uniref:NIL domain-containing protein n=1 Tax=Pseudonocardia ailaonensis TaxID=367279 RepID=A0ABN2MTZ0_9PSEU
MSITFDIPTATGTRMLRKHTIVTTGGMAAVLEIAAELRDCSALVKELTIDVHEGVGCSELTCAVTMTAEEAAEFATQLRALPAVSSVDPY